MLNNEVHQKDNISRILWYSDWLKNTILPPEIVFLLPITILLPAEEVLCNISDYENMNMRNDMWRLTF